MATVVVEAKGLTKTYQDHTVVNQISFEIFEGECFGLLGPNGAGKSSTLKMMYGQTGISNGEAFILGLNVKSHPKEVKFRIGIIPQDNGLEEDFSVLDNLLTFAEYFQIPFNESMLRSKKLLRLMHLEENQDQLVRNLSGGMKRRLTIARSLIHQPDLLILDEPTTGLDPQSRYFLWNFLKSMRKEHKTLILTTHYMEEAESLCDRVAIMDKGKILAIGTPQELIAAHTGHQVVEIQLKPEEISYYEKRLNIQSYDYTSIDTGLVVYLHGQQTPQDLFKIVESESFTIRKPCLNDVFLKMAGHTLRNLE